MYVGDEARLDGHAAGEQSDCAFHWRYSRDTPMSDGKSILLNFNDWFYRIDERVVMVRGSAARGCPLLDTARYLSQDVDAGTPVQANNQRTSLRGPVASSPC